MQSATYTSPLEGTKHLASHNTLRPCKTPMLRELTSVQTAALGFADRLIDGENEFIGKGDGLNEELATVSNDVKDGQHELTAKATNRTFAVRTAA